MCLSMLCLYVCGCSSLKPLPFTHPHPLTKTKSVQRGKETQLRKKKTSSHKSENGPHHAHTRSIQRQLMYLSFLLFTHLSCCSSAPFGREDAALWDRAAEGVVGLAPGLDGG